MQSTNVVMQRMKEKTRGQMEYDRNLRCSQDWTKTREQTCFSLAEVTLFNVKKLHVVEKPPHFIICHLYFKKHLMFSLRPSSEVLPKFKDHFSAFLLVFFVLVVISISNDHQVIAHTGSMGSWLYRGPAGQEIPEKTTNVSRSDEPAASPARQLGSVQYKV